MLPSSNETVITYEVLQEQDFNEASTMISETFCQREPISKLLQLEVPEFEDYVRTVLYLNPGISYVAKYDQKIVACLINDTPNNVVSFDEETSKRISPRFEIYDAIIKDLTDDFLKEFDKEKKATVAHVDLLGIAENYSGRGIAFNLLSFAKADLKRKGFDTYYMECTNICSERLANKDGWTHKKTVDYRVWSHKGKLPLSTIPSNHNLVLFATKL